MAGLSLFTRVIGSSMAQKTVGGMVSDEKLEQLIKTTALAIEGDAKHFAPVDTTRLRGSIHSGKAGKLEWMVGTNVEYAIYQEYGTRYQSGTPYLRPAVEKNRMLVAGKAKIVFK